MSSYYTLLFLLLSLLPLPSFLPTLPLSTALKSYLILLLTLTISTDDAYRWEYGEIALNALLLLAGLNALLNNPALIKFNRRLEEGGESILEGAMVARCIMLFLLNYHKPNPTLLVAVVAALLPFSKIPPPHPNAPPNTNKPRPLLPLQLRTDKHLPFNPLHKRSSHTRALHLPFNVPLHVFLEPLPPPRPRLRQRSPPYQIPRNRRRPHTRTLRCVRRIRYPRW